jgi:hypothetical protein
MDTNEIFAYIQGPDTKAVSAWIESLVTDLERKETSDLTEAIGVIMVRFECRHDFLLLEQHVGTGWLELTIRSKTPGSVFAAWDSLKLGERLVDDLGGITIVGCGGIYVDPLAPFMVRISADKMELVELPDMIGDPFDENQTQLIKKR